MNNRLRYNLCYLAGPMDRVDFAEAREWREWITPILQKRGIGVLDPCNKPLMGAKEDPAIHQLSKTWKAEEEWNKLRDTYKPIVGVDLRMVDQAAFLVVMIDVESHMCGTYHELFMATSQRKPVLCMVKQGKDHTPNWLFGLVPHQHLFSSWDELLEYVRHVDEDDDVDHMRRWTFFDFKKVWGDTDAICGTAGS